MSFKDSLHHALLSNRINSVTHTVACMIGEWHRVIIVGQAEHLSIQCTVEVNHCTTYMSYSKTIKSLEMPGARGEGGIGGQVVEKLVLSC